jgi:hypothetical protein
MTVRLMSDRELQRLEVLRDLSQKRLTTKAAGQLLGMMSASPSDCWQPTTAQRENRDGG